MWLDLGALQYSAATFDVWSTRRAISSGTGHELKPMLRPFAGHAWARHKWWLPQTIGTAMPFASGTNNLRIRATHSSAAVLGIQKVVEKIRNFRALERFHQGFAVDMRNESSYFTLSYFSRIRSIWRR